VVGRGGLVGSDQAVRSITAAISAAMWSQV